MVIATHNPSAFPDSLHDELHSCSAAGGRFLLRAVLVRDLVKHDWVLMAAVLRPAPPASTDSSVWKYSGALLSSEVLDLDAAQEFMQKAATGEMVIAGTALQFNPPQGCRTTRVPVNNYWMEPAGSVYEVCIHQQVNIPQQEPLIAPGAPYYPDAYEGARDWLGLSEYHGSSDSSHGHLLVLVPETRAYIVGGHWKDDDLLLEVGGSLVKEPGFSVIGAYWIGKQIHQLAAAIVDARAQLNVPPQADRLDLHVVAGHGEVLDSYTENSNFPGRGMRILTKRTESAAQASDLTDIYSGEGVRTEFKESLELTDEKMSNSEKDKLAEVLRTVAAFANTQGGTIYFGVSDAIEIVGTQHAVAKWAKGEPNESAINGYMGALRARVHDVMYPGVTLHARAMDHQGRLIIALNVDKSLRPVCITHDKMTYTRVSSNNVKTAAADLAAAKPSAFE